MSSNLSTSTTNPQLRSHRATQLGSLWSHMFEDKPRQRCSSSNPRRKPRMKKFLAQPFAGPSLVTILMQMLRRRRQPQLHLVEETIHPFCWSDSGEVCSPGDDKQADMTELRAMLLSNLIPKREKLSFHISKMHEDTPLHITESEATHRAGWGERQWTTRLGNTL